MQPQFKAGGDGTVGQAWGWSGLGLTNKFTKLPE